MPKQSVISRIDRARIERAVNHFGMRRHLFENVAKSLVIDLTGHPELARHIHFIKWRVKNEASLRNKLERKTLVEKVRSPQDREGYIDETNLAERVVDLAGVRILHLHTEQMREIHEWILRILEEHRYQLAGEPTAHCWDAEYEQLFKSFGIRTEARESMYTTVHYDIVANQETKVTCELQVRSLMDEVWSEVSHRVNYPNTSDSESCQDQLKVLARLTTGGTRLVDSIFKTYALSSEDG